MLHFITARNRSKHVDLCDSMYRNRKAVFIDRLGWGLKVSEGGREIDQFDHADAVYVIEAEGKRHLASLRLLPTIEPHLMSEVFPFLCDGEVPRGPDIWELTRLCINPELSREDQKRLRGVVWHGALQYAFAAGIRKFTGVTHAQFLSAVLASGLDIEPLGLPQNYAGAMIGAHMVHFGVGDMRREERKLGLAATLVAEPELETVG